MKPELDTLCSLDNFILSANFQALIRTTHCETTACNITILVQAFFSDSLFFFFLAAAAIKSK